MKINILKITLLICLPFLCLFLYFYISSYYIPNTVKTFFNLYKENKINFINSIHGYEFDKESRTYTHVRMVSKSLNNEILVKIFSVDLEPKSLKILKTSSIQESLLKCNKPFIMFPNKKELSDTLLWKQEEIYSKKILDLYQTYHLHAITSMCGNDIMFHFTEGRLFKKSNWYMRLHNGSWSSRRTFLDNNWVYEKRSIYQKVADIIIKVLTGA